MQIKTKTFDITYTVFEVGERVTPSSSRCPLDPGVYIITRCIEPRSPGDDDSIVFVEGHDRGISAEYLMPADVTEEERGG